MKFERRRLVVKGEIERRRLVVKGEFERRRLVVKGEIERRRLVAKSVSEIDVVLQSPFGWADLQRVCI